MNRPLTFHIVTFGCQMNKGESDLMKTSLIDAGFIEATSPGDADAAVYNTCSVREHAEQRALGVIRGSNPEIRKRGGVTVVAGCMAQRIGGELIMDGTADLVIGPYRTPDAGRILAEFLEDRKRNSYMSQDRGVLADRLPVERLTGSGPGPWHKFVTISHGCDNRCSYCIVPAVRGPLISFPSSRILEYLKILAEKGATEITLMGQNVNQFGTDSGDIPFHKLLDAASSISGFDRVNFITSHPKDFTEDIVKVIRDSETISRSIHLPLQSGSDRVLELMNRGYTMKRYGDIVGVLHRHLDSFSLSTDLIVGFPGESRDEFQQTLAAVESIRFDDAFMYAYSPRPGTVSEELAGACPAAEKKERLMELIARQRAISAEKLLQRVDSVESAIIERISKKSERSVMGKTFLNHPIVIPGSSEDIGKRVSVKVRAVSGSTLQGIRIA